MIYQSANSVFREGKARANTSLPVSINFVQKSYSSIEPTGKEGSEIVCPKERGGGGEVFPGH